MKQLHEYLITFFSQLDAMKYSSEFNKFMVKLTWGGRAGPTPIYIYKEGIGKTNIFESNYCRW
jgi:hypothetical protein